MSGSVPPEQPDNDSTVEEKSVIHEKRARDSTLNSNIPILQLADDGYRRSEGPQLRSPLCSGQTTPHVMSVEDQARLQVIPGSSSSGLCGGPSTLDRHPDHTSSARPGQNVPPAQPSCTGRKWTGCKCTGGERTGNEACRRNPGVGHVPGRSSAYTGRARMMVGYGVKSDADQPSQSGRLSRPPVPFPLPVPGPRNGVVRSSTLALLEGGG